MANPNEDKEFKCKYDDTSFTLNDFYTALSKIESVSEMETISELYKLLNLDKLCCRLVLYRPELHAILIEQIQSESNGPGVSSPKFFPADVDFFPSPAENA